MGLLLGERLPKISDVGFRTVESKTVLPTNDWTFCKVNFYFEGLLIKGLLTWRKGYPSTRKAKKAKQLFVWFTCRNFGRGGWVTKWRMKARRNFRPLATERPAAATFVFLVLPSEGSLHGARIFLVLLASSSLS